MADEPVLYEAVIEGGKHWSLTVRRGVTMRLVDVDGGANVGMLLYNPQDKLERYNAPDTLKCQQTFKLTKGCCLYSDMGRIFCSVTEDSLGWHDTVGGVSDRAMVEARWGARSYQDFRNDWLQNGRDAFLVEAVKHGLNRRDLHANVNWFSKVAVADDGALSFASGWSSPGSFVDLRFEMDTLLLLHTCPHPMDSSPECPRRPVRAELRRAAPAAAPDVCFDWRPENRRGFANTEAYHLGCPSC
jgi:urea carboxylase-associated protein 2